MVKLDILERRPPAVIESEKALLGSVLMMPDKVIDNVVGHTGATDFYDESLGRIYGILCGLHAAGFPVGDLKATLAELKRQGVYESLGGAAFIAELVSQTQWVHAVTYAKQVAATSVLRQQLRICADWIDRIYNEEPAEDCAAWVETQLACLSGNGASGSRQADEVADQVIGELDRPNIAPPVMTGMFYVDSAIGGWMPGELVVLAARPGCGKTAMGLQIATYNAESSRRVLFASLEMADHELATRVLCTQSGINSRRVRSGEVTQSERDRLKQAAAEIRHRPLVIWSPPTATIGKIAAVARREAARGGLSLLVVDYIGLIRSDNDQRPRHEQVAAISAQLKGIAKDLHVPVLALCQLNREAHGKEPTLAQLRESGAIEQDADIVLFIHQMQDRQAKLIVAKHRHGETGSCMLGWEPERTRFVGGPSRHEEFDDFA